jgi:hypothetical protein
VAGVQLCHGRLDGESQDCMLVERLFGDATAGRQRHRVVAFDAEYDDVLALVEAGSGGEVGD